MRRTFLRSLVVAALAASCTLKTSTTPTSSSSTSPPQSGSGAVPGTPPVTVPGTVTISTTTTFIPTTPTTTTTTTTTSCYGTVLDGTLASVPDVPDPTVEEACLLTAPASVAEHCAYDADWAAAFGGNCPSATGFEAALVSGAALGWNNYLVVDVARWSCTDPADGTTWSAYRLTEHCFDCGDEVVLFDGAGALRAIDWDWSATYPAGGACCGGAMVEDTWIGELPPLGLACTPGPDLDLSTDTGATGGSGS